MTEVIPDRVWWGHEQVTVPIGVLSEDGVDELWWRVGMRSVSRAVYTSDLLISKIFGVPKIFLVESFRLPLSRLSTIIRSGVRRGGGRICLFQRGAFGRIPQRGAGYSSYTLHFLVQFEILHKNTCKVFCVYLLCIPMYGCMHVYRMYVCMHAFRQVLALKIYPKEYWIF